MTVATREKQQATSAAEYRQLAKAARERRESELPTELVPMPSGAVWEMRRPDIQGYVLVGVYPQSLVNEAMAAFKKGGTIPDTAAVATEKLDVKDTVDLLVFARDLTLRSLVSPKIGYGEDEVLPTDIDPEDFKYAMRWCMSHQGVAGVDGLRSFRERQERGTATNRPTGKKQRSKIVKRAANRG